MGGHCKHDFDSAEWNCVHCGASAFEVKGYIDEEALHKQQADREAVKIMTEYAQGGDYIPVQLSRGEAVMSRASLAALGEDMIKKLLGDVDIYIAEELLEEDDE